MGVGKIRGRHEFDSLSAIKTASSCLLLEQHPLRQMYHCCVSNSKQTHVVSGKVDRSEIAEEVADSLIKIEIYALFFTVIVGRRTSEKRSTLDQFVGKH
ncbi:hypothetical protein NPIL_144311 [Nephila pilipes]|uniref:Uncharacterized protein n=1 Tax=Nephila pilipes TaxID=299642 RepID=A0A8X6P613_NEPPI|nr:hypothetical protein NPIL_144311 [Nephila pilipes]